MQSTLVVYLLFSVLLIVSGQQQFQRRGDHYLAKVAIRRFKPENFAVGVNEQSGQHQVQRHRYRPAHRRHPWRQGDRITKEEVVQNLARALLSRPRDKEEIEKEKRKDNEEKLREYALYQARLAMNPPTAPPRLSYSQQPAGGNSYPSSPNVANPAFPQRPIRTKLERKDEYYKPMNAGPADKQRASANVQETRYAKTIARGYPQQPQSSRVLTRQYMKSNSFQKR